MSTPPPLVTDPLRLPPPRIHTPRILCLHGGGTNAEVLRLQCRGLTARLCPPTTSPAAHGQPRFRLVFANAPFLSNPHSQIASSYSAMAPYRRWLRWQPGQEERDGDAMARDTLASIRDTMADDDVELGRSGKIGGEWVGVLGFSQGAKIAMSLLWAQERAEDEVVARMLAEAGVTSLISSAQSDRDAMAASVRPEELPLGVRFRFGIIMAGRAPVVRIIPNWPAVPGVADMSILSSEYNEWLDPATELEGHKVCRTPTLHVHGMRDQGLELHRRLRDEYCAERSGARCVEWDGDHRLPIRSEDVDIVVNAILALAADTGVEY